MSQDYEDVATYLHALNSTRTTLQHKRKHYQKTNEKCVNEGTCCCYSIRNKQQICPASIPCLQQWGLSEVKPCSSTQPHLFQATLWTAVCQNASLIADSFWRGMRSGRGSSVDDLKNSSLKTSFLKVHIKSDRGQRKHSHLQLGLCWCHVCGMNIKKLQHSIQQTVMLGNTAMFSRICSST